MSRKATLSDRKRTSELAEGPVTDKAQLLSEQALEMGASSKGAGYPAADDAIADLVQLHHFWRKEGTCNRLTYTRFEQASMLKQSIASWVNQYVEAGKRQGLGQAQAIDASKGFLLEVCEGLRQQGVAVSELTISSL